MEHCIQTIHHRYMVAVTIFDFISYSLTENHSLDHAKTKVQRNMGHATIIRTQSCGVCQLHYSEPDSSVPSGTCCSTNCNMLALLFFGCNHNVQQQSDIIFCQSG